MAEVWNDESPTLFLIREHFKDFRLSSWDNARVARLCKTLNATVPEVCALAGVFGKARVRALWQRGEQGKFWPTEIGLHFSNLERFAGERTFRTASPPSPAEVQTALLLNRHG